MRRQLIVSSETSSTTSWSDIGNTNSHISDSFSMVDIRSQSHVVTRSTSTLNQVTQREELEEMPVSASPPLRLMGSSERRSRSLPPSSPRLEKNALPASARRLSSVSFADSNQDQKLSHLPWMTMQGDSIATWRMSMTSTPARRSPVLISTTRVAPIRHLDEKVTIVAPSPQRQELHRVPSHVYYQSSAVAPNWTPPNSPRPASVVQEQQDAADQNQNDAVSETSTWLHVAAYGGKDMLVSGGISLTRNNGLFQAQGHHQPTHCRRRHSFTTMCMTQQVLSSQVSHSWSPPTRQGRCARHADWSGSEDESDAEQTTWIRRRVRTAATRWALSDSEAVMGRTAALMQDDDSDSEAQTVHRQNILRQAVARARLRLRVERLFATQRERSQCRIAGCHERVPTYYDSPPMMPTMKVTPGFSSESDACSHVESEPSIAEKSNSTPSSSWTDWFYQAWQSASQSVFKNMGSVMSHLFIFAVGIYVGHRFTLLR